MRRKIEDKLDQLITLTKENPGEYNRCQLAAELDLGLSTVRKYVAELNLPVKKTLRYTDDQRAFIKANAATMSNAEVCKKLGILPYPGARYR